MTGLRLAVLPALVLCFCANTPPAVDEAAAEVATLEPEAAPEAAVPEGEPATGPDVAAAMDGEVEAEAQIEEPELSEARALIVPAKTPIRLEILEDVGSKISKSGDTFALRLAEPLVYEGVEMIPAGTTGHGEVVHAKKNGSFGVPGELVLAARELDFAGRKIRLRSMKIAEAGKGRTEGVGLATAAAGMPALAVGLFIRGDQVMVAKGTVADAMIAEEFVPETEAGTEDQLSVTP